MRRKACEEINKMFGLDVWCDFREDFRELTDEMMIEDDTGGHGVVAQSADANMSGVRK